MEVDEELDSMEIPSHFLCPISLQLMHDPVTLSSGISFDRPSIEHWLRRSKKNDTSCPVTKQPLSSAELTPNLTLRRLILSWCSLHSVGPPTGPAYNLASLASRLLHPSTTRNDAVEAISALADAHSSGHDLRPLVTDALLDRLISFLRSEVSSIKLLKELYAAADPATLTAAKPALFSEIVKLLRDHDRVSGHSSEADLFIRHWGQAYKWALKLLLELAPWGRNRVKAVNAGATDALIGILLGGAQKRVCELAMAGLDQLCGCAEGRAALVAHGAGLAVVSKRILRVSTTVTHRAVKILGSVSKNAANGGVLAEMVEVGVVAKLCLVAQVEGSTKTKERAKEILRAHSRVWKNSPCIPPHLLPSYPS